MNYISILITSTLTTGQSSLPQFLKEQLVQFERQEESERQNQQMSQETSIARVTPPEFMQSDEISPDNGSKLLLNQEDFLEKTREKLASECLSKYRKINSRKLKIKMTNINYSDFSCHKTKSLKLTTRVSRLSEQSSLKLLFASTKLNKILPSRSRLYSQIIFRRRFRYQYAGGLGRINRAINYTQEREILPTLHFGHTGIPVKILQRLLIYNGYAISVDGIFGALTETAVKAFQNQRDLGVDGVVGNKTWRALSQ